MNKSQEKVISTLLTAVVATTGVAVATGSPVKAATKTSQTQLLKNAKFAVERAEASVNKAYVVGNHATPKLDYIVAAQNAVRKLSSSATKTSYAQRTSRAMSKAVQQLSQLTATVGTLSKDKDVVKVFIDFARSENQYVPYANLKATFETRLAAAEKALGTDDATETAAEAAAEKAVAAYEAAPLTSAAAVTAAEALEAPAKTAVAAVKDTAKNTVFTSRIAAQKAKVDAAKASFVSLAVSSVTAINATQAQVVFTQAVAGGTNANAQNANNYSINGVHPSTAVLQSDGKTVILTFADATTLNGASNAGVTNLAVIVEPIASATDSYTLSGRYVSLLTYKDTVKPAIASITSTTNASKASSVTVNFTEPISSLGSVKIDGTGVNGALATDGLSATFTIDLDATTAHSIQFFGLTDKAANVADLFTQSFNVTVDKAVPTATVAPSADVDNAFVLTFSKDMVPSTVTNAAINVLDENLGASFGNSISVTQPDLTNKKVYLVKGNGAIFGTKSSRTFTVALPATMSDTLGNTFAATTTSVTLTKDTVKPAIGDVKVVKDPSTGKVTKIVLTSDSALSAATLAGLTVVDSNGVLCTGSTSLGALSISPAVTAGDKTVTIVPTTSATMTGKYTFNFAAGTLSDEAQTANTSDAVVKVVDFGAASATTGTFTIPSANVAAHAAALQASATTNEYKINFGTAVKGGDVAGSATDLARYTINGNALPAGTTITLDSTKNTATITLPAGTVSKTDTGAILYIAGVQDLSGNTVVPVTTAVQVNDNVNPVLNSAVLNSDNTITVGTSEALAADPTYTTDLVVKINGTAVPGLTIDKGTGTDVGKYLVKGLSTLEKYDGTSTTYLDLDNSGTLNSGDITLSTVGGNKSSSKLTDFNAITSITVTSATAPTAKDAANNTLTGSTTLTIK